jgi:hypothetical protein
MVKLLLRADTHSRIDANYNEYDDVKINYIQVNSIVNSPQDQIQFESNISSECPFVKKSKAESYWHWINVYLRNDNIVNIQTDLLKEGINAFLRSHLF